MPVDRVGTAAGETCLFAPPDPRQRYVGVSLEYDARIDVTVLGVRGMTATAHDGAQRAAQAAQDAATKLRDRRDDPPGAGRSLLKKGMRYKLVVGQEAVGTRPGQAPETFPGPGQALERTFWFETPGDTTPVAGRPLRSLIFKRRDEFDPRYLERYLLGYTPGDHTQSWFTGDPLAAHFDADPAFPNRVVAHLRRRDRVALPVDRKLEPPVPLALLDSARSRRLGPGVVEVEG